MKRNSVLECEHEKYYVGKTSLPLEMRFHQHASGRGAIWTRIHPPLRIIETRPYQSFEETRVTLEYMRRYVHDKVRGAEWCSIKLSAEEIDEIQRKINAEEVAVTLVNDWVIWQAHALIRIVDVPPMWASQSFYRYVLCFHHD